MSRRAPARLRLWSGFTASALVGLSAVTLVLAGANTQPAFAGLGKPADVRTVLVSAVTRTVPTVSELTAPTGRYFGLAATQTPYSTSETNQIADLAGRRPDMLAYFSNFTEDFRADAVAAAYRQGALPVLTWEPWSGQAGGSAQPAYAPREIVAGGYDDYIRRYATAVRDQGWPVVLRFAHEMNGSWYPWGVGVNGNQAADYVAMWRHVHDIFTEVGTTNVIWVWSPNIIRPVKDVALQPLYPGDAYVDWIGVTGYATSESDAAAVFEPTLDRLRALTSKPLLITETGASPGAHKAPFTASLTTWVASRPDVLGFVWFERTSPSSGNDWRFETDPAALAAMRAGLARYPAATYGTNRSEQHEAAG